MASHESGKKGPEAMAFRQVINGKKTPLPRALPIRLGSKVVPIVDRQRVFGLNIAAHPRLRTRVSRRVNYRTEQCSI